MIFAQTQDEKRECDVSSELYVGSVCEGHFGHINERRLLWKIDLRVVLLVFVMNFFTFLDRYTFHIYSLRAIADLPYMQE